MKVKEKFWIGAILACVLALGSCGAKANDFAVGGGETGVPDGFPSVEGDIVDGGNGDGEQDLEISPPPDNSPRGNGTITKIMNFSSVFFQRAERTWPSGRKKIPRKKARIR